ncbi:MAG: LysR substrate-binding domain-containing protein [Pseudobdellovibrio sp.]
MTLQQLKYILAIEQHLSFNLAADFCHVAQPSLSAQVKKLEDELGITLFDRSTSSGVRVTSIGRSILAHARSVLSEAQKLEDECSFFNKEVSGTLRIGIIPTISPYLVPHFINTVYKDYPQLELEISEDKTENLIHELHHGRIDAAILSTPKKAPENLIEKLLYYEPFTVYASQGHPLLEKKEIRLSSISDYAVTLLDETHCLRDQVVSACGLNIKESNQGQIRLKNGGLQTLVSIVDRNNSFTLIPKLAESVLHFEHRKTGTREIIAPTPFRKISLLFHSSYGRKSLIDALQKTIQSSLPESVSTQKNPKGLIVDPSLNHFKKI